MSLLPLATELSACSRGKGKEAASVERELVIFAATSLREAFTAIGEDFTQAHPGVALRFNFAGTQELRTQLEHGAAADVFASADQRHMQDLLRAARVSAPVSFARNEPVVVLSREAGGLFADFSELPRATRIVVGSPEVPIGRYTLQILEHSAKRWGQDFRSQVESRIVSRELNARQVLAKVRLGEADAGIVYRSDAVAAPELASLIIPADVNVIAEYPIAVASGALQAELAHAWVLHVRSLAGQASLARAGFLAPAASGGQ